MLSSVLIVFLVFIFISYLIFSNIKIRQKRAQNLSKIESLKEEIRVLEEKKKELEEKSSKAESREYLEKIAREQLGMKAPGEEVVVVNKEEQENQTQQEAEKKNFWNPIIWWNWLIGRR